MICMTAFDPFGALAENPSQLVLQRFLQETNDPHLYTQILPTSFAQAGAAITHILMPSLELLL